MYNNCIICIICIIILDFIITSHIDDFKEPQ